MTAISHSTIKHHPISTHFCFAPSLFSFVSLLSFESVTGATSLKWKHPVVGAVVSLLAVKEEEVEVVGETIETTANKELITNVDEYLTRFFFAIRSDFIIG